MTPKIKLHFQNIFSKFFCLNRLLKNVFSQKINRKNGIFYTLFEIKKLKKNLKFFSCILEFIGSINILLLCNIMSPHSKLELAALNIYRDITKFTTCYGFFLIFNFSFQFLICFKLLIFFRFPTCMSWYSTLETSFLGSTFLSLSGWCSSSQTSTVEGIYSRIWWRCVEGFNTP